MDGFASSGDDSPQQRHLDQEALALDAFALGDPFLLTTVALPALNWEAVDAQQRAMEFDDGPLPAVPAGRFDFQGAGVPPSPHPHFAPRASGYDAPEPEFNAFQPPHSVNGFGLIRGGVDAPSRAHAAPHQVPVAHRPHQQPAPLQPLQQHAYHPWAGQGPPVHQQPLQQQPRQQQPHLLPRPLDQFPRPQRLPNRPFGSMSAATVTVALDPMPEVLVALNPAGRDRLSRFFFLRKHNDLRCECFNRMEVLVTPHHVESLFQVKLERLPDPKWDVGPADWDLEIHESGLRELQTRHSFLELLRALWEGRGDPGIAVVHCMLRFRLEPSQESEMREYQLDVPFQIMSRTEHEIQKEIAIVRNAFGNADFEQLFDIAFHMLSKAKRRELRQRVQQNQSPSRGDSSLARSQCHGAPYPDAITIQANALVMRTKAQSRHRNLNGQTLDMLQAQFKALGANVIWISKDVDEFEATVVFFFRPLSGTAIRGLPAALAAVFGTKVWRFVFSRRAPLCFPRPHGARFRLQRSQSSQNLSLATPPLTQRTVSSPMITSLPETTTRASDDDKAQEPRRSAAVSPAEGHADPDASAVVQQSCQSPPSQPADTSTSSCVDGDKLDGGSLRAGTSQDSCPPVGESGPSSPSLSVCDGPDNLPSTLQSPSGSHSTAPTRAPSRRPAVAILPQLVPSSSPPPISPDSDILHLTVRDAIRRIDAVKCASSLCLESGDGVLATFLQTVTSRGTLLPNLLKLEGASRLPCGPLSYKRLEAFAALVPNLEHLTVFIQSQAAVPCLLLSLARFKSLTHFNVIDTSSERERHEFWTQPAISTLFEPLRHDGELTAQQRTLSLELELGEEPLRAALRGFTTPCPLSLAVHAVVPLPLIPRNVRELTARTFGPRSVSLGDPSLAPPPFRRLSLGADDAAFADAVAACEDEDCSIIPNFRQSSSGPDETHQLDGEREIEPEEAPEGDEDEWVRWESPVSVSPAASEDTGDTSAFPESSSSPGAVMRAAPGDLLKVFMDNSAGGHGQGLTMEKTLARKRAERKLMVPSHLVFTECALVDCCLEMPAEMLAGHFPSARKLVLLLDTKWGDVHTVRGLHSFTFISELEVTLPKDTRGQCERETEHDMLEELSQMPEINKKTVMLDGETFAHRRSIVGRVGRVARHFKRKSQQGTSPSVHGTSGSSSTATSPLSIRESGRSPSTGSKFVDTAASSCPTSTRSARSLSTGVNWKRSGRRQQAVE